MRPLFTRILFLCLALALAAAQTAPALAQSGQPPAQVTLAQPAFSLPWYAGVVLVGIIAVGVTRFKNRLTAGRKKPVLTGSCCAPVVDE